MEALMPSARQRIVIVGAGHNGLVAAFYLAKAGYAPLVLERREVAGGSAITEEIHPGFRCPALFDATGPLLPRIANDMQLDRQGLEPLRPDLTMLALHPDAPPLRIYEDPERTAAEIARL